MVQDEKGVFPLWMDEEDIISQLLHKMLSEGGKIPYSFVINQNHDPATQERMRIIVARMEREKLINPVSNEFADIELGLNGSRAALMGYRKNKQKQRWGSLSNNATMTFFRLILVGACAGILYLLLHYFKII